MAEDHPHISEVVVAEKVFHDEHVKESEHHHHHHDEHVKESEHHHHHHDDASAVVSERGCLHDHVKESEHQQHHDVGHVHHRGDAPSHVESEEVLVLEFNEVGVTKVEEDNRDENQHRGFVEKLQRSHSSSSSSSSDEEGDAEEKKKKKREKKSLKEKIKEKIFRMGEKPVTHEGETVVVVEKKEEVQVVEAEADQPGKKGFLDKVKEKLPGGSHSTAAAPHADAPPTEEGHGHGCECECSPKEKKGLLEKIKEKLPGYRPKSGGAESTSH